MFKKLLLLPFLSLILCANSFSKCAPGEMSITARNFSNCPLQVYRTFLNTHLVTGEENTVPEIFAKFTMYENMTSSESMGIEMCVKPNSHLFIRMYDASFDEIKKMGATFGQKISESYNGDVLSTVTDTTIKITDVSEKFSTTHHGGKVEIIWEKI